jgi:hypothetical protein
MTSNLHVIEELILLLSYSCYCQQLLPPEVISQTHMCDTHTHTHTLSLSIYIYRSERESVCVVAHAVYIKMDSDYRLSSWHLCSKAACEAIFA